MTTGRSSLINVLVTGVGALIGQGIIKSLRKSKYAIRVVGVDRNDKTPGTSLSDVFYKKPDCSESDEEYRKFWMDTLLSESIDIVLPGLESDVMFLDKHRDLVIGSDSVLAINHSELLQKSADKWKMHKELGLNGIAQIPTVLSTSWLEVIDSVGEPPILLKPRYGDGSRGIVTICDEHDFDYWIKRSGSDPMLQKIVGDESEEYTVGVFGLGDGKALPAVVFKRKLSIAGNTQVAEVVDDKVVISACAQLTSLFKPVGPTNYQFRKEDGIAYLLEINPRFSSSNSLRTEFGFNEAEMSIDYFLHKNTPTKPSIRAGIGWRYYEDFVEYDCNII